MAQPDLVEASDHQRARILYEEYNDAGENPWKTFSGAPCPPWVALTPDVQAKWTAVARYTRLERKNKR